MMLSRNTSAFNNPIFFFYDVVPSPLSVKITSDAASPILVLSAVKVTCTVRLHSAVDVPVTVNTVWNGPSDFAENRVAQRVQSTNVYTSEIMFSSFGRNQSGNYSCSAYISSYSQFLINSRGQRNTSRITIGKRTCLSDLYYMHVVELWPPIHRLSRCLHFSK